MSYYVDNIRDTLHFKHEHIYHKPDCHIPSHIHHVYDFQRSIFWLDIVVLENDNQALGEKTDVKSSDYYNCRSVNRSGLKFNQKGKLQKK